jgi:hypothetical protein
MRFVLFVEKRENKQSRNGTIGAVNISILFANAETPTARTLERHTFMKSLTGTFPTTTELSIVRNMTRWQRLLKPTEEG